MRQAASYPCSGVPCKICAESGLESLLAEALGREVAADPRVQATLSHQPSSPIQLRLQLPQRVLDEFGADALALEVVPDCGIAVTTAGQRVRSAPGEAIVVHEARPSEHTEGLAHDRRRDRRPLQALRQSNPGEVPRSEGAARDGESLGAAWTHGSAANSRPGASAMRLWRPLSATILHGTPERG
jgi:hypothetical protein